MAPSRGNATIVIKMAKNQRTTSVNWLQRHQDNDDKLNKSTITLKHNCLVLHGLSTSDTQYSTTQTHHPTHLLLGSNERLSIVKALYEYGY